MFGRTGDQPASTNERRQQRTTSDQRL